MRHQKHTTDARLAHLEPPRLERVVTSILVKAGPELARRRRRRDPLHVMTTWRRPILAFAGSVTAAGLATLLLVDSGDAAPADAVRLDAAIPDVVLIWLAEGQPDFIELLTVVAEEQR